MSDSETSSLATDYGLDMDHRRLPANVVERNKSTGSETSKSDSLDGNEHDSSRENNFIWSDVDTDTESDSECNDALDIDTEDCALRVYLKFCDKHGRTPYSGIRKGLLQPLLRCKYQHLHPLDVRAICCALLESWRIEKIHFEYNGLGPASAMLFSQVIVSSPYLSHVSLPNNNIGSEGARTLCEAAQHNANIIALDLTGNGLVEGDGKYFQKLIEESDRLQELYLGHNSLQQKGVEAIANGLTYTASLKVLDLKWNHIRLKGAAAICKALRYNASLEKLDVSWNGLHSDGAEALAEALPKNDTLLELDISCNRLDERCFAHVLKGLRGNSVLQRLRSSENHITSKGAKTILTELCKYKTSGLKLLDLGTLEVTDSFVKMYDNLRQTRDIKIVYGLVWKEDRPPVAKDISVERALLQCDPLIVIMECIRLQNLRLTDFFKSLDKDKNGELELEEFCDGLLKINVPISKRVLHILIKKLDLDGNGHIDFCELIEAHKMHRAMVRECMMLDKDLSKTEIGKVDYLLSQIFEANNVNRMKTTRPRS